MVSAIDLSLVNQTDATISWTSVFTTGGSYIVDVSSTDFTSGGNLLTGYPLSITGTSTIVGTDVNTEALLPASNYWIRVRASNASGESSNSNVVTFLTEPGTPIALPATDVQNESFKANWEAVAGADEYTLEVSNNNFTSTVFSTATTETTATVNSGLAVGTTYVYRVFSKNATGSSLASNEIEVTTNFPPSDLLLDNLRVDENQPVGTLVGTLSVSDPDDNTHTYELVAGTGDTDNVSFAIDGSNLITNEVFNFESDANYSVRIRATDPKGASAEEKSFGITIDNTNDAPSEISLFTTGFSPTGYDAIETEVGIFSTTDQDVGDTDANIKLALTSGEDSFKIIKNANGDSTLLVTAIVFTNEEDLVMPITVQATDDEGASVAQNFDVTIKAFVDTENPQFDQTVVNPTTFVIGANYDSLALKAEVSDFRIKEVKLFTKLLTDTEFTSKVLLELDQGIYVDSIGQDDLGVAGIEYYFEATDEAGNSRIWSTAEFFAPSKLGLEFPSDGEGAPVVESVTKFGRTVDSYQIISVPFVFDNPNSSSVGALFDEYGSQPDNRTWRIIKYNNATGELDNLSEGSQIETGAGYFFIAQEEQQIIIENAKINTQDPFPLELKQGWNLIGNPYNLDIDFDAVIQNNSAVGIVQSLRVLDTENPETWPESSVLRSLEGGFVFSSQDITLNVSYTDAFLSFGGRAVETEPEAEWFFPITLEQNGDMRKGGIGMDRNANVSLDMYDEPVLPKWLEFLEIAFLHEGERFDRYNKDVIPFTDSSIWNFEVSSSTAGISVLRWDPSASPVRNLQLLDVENGRVIDMTQQSSYSFGLNGTAKFKILYSHNLSDQFDFGQLQILEAYPNPFQTSFKIPVQLPIADRDQTIAVSLLDLNGKTLWSSIPTSLSGGAYEFEVTRPEGLLPGVYLYKVSLSVGLDKNVYTKRITVK